jgi:hypothetical protein
LALKQVILILPDRLTDIDNLSHAAPLPRCKLATNESNEIGLNGLLWFNFDVMKPLKVPAPTQTLAANANIFSVTVSHHHFSLVNIDKNLN